MKKILVLTGMGPCLREPYQGLYVTRQVEQLIKFADLDICYCYPQGKIAQYRGMIKYGGFFLLFIWRFIFSTKRFDIVHVHYYYPTIVFALIYKWLRAPKVKIICTFHGSDVYLHQNPGWMYRTLAKCIDHAVFVSPDFGERIKKHIALNYDVLPVGADERFCPEPKVEKIYDLLFVGNLNHNKGSDRLITLLRALPETTRVAIAGTGEYKDQFEQFGNVDCLGVLEQKELLNLYRQGRFILNLSRVESFGLSMTEAMLCGTPAIATASDGSRFQINHGGNGFIVENDDQWLGEQLARFVEKQLSVDAKAYQSLCASAAETSQQFGLATIARQVRAIYLQ